MELLPIKQEDDSLLSAGPPSTTFDWSAVKVKEEDGFETNAGVKVKGGKSYVTMELVPKVGFIPEENGSGGATENKLMVIKTEHIIAPSEDRTFLAYQFVDTSILTKEEDLGVYFEEEEEFARIADSCALVEEKESPFCSDKALPEVARNQGDVLDSFQDSALPLSEESEPVVSLKDLLVTDTHSSEKSSDERPFVCLPCNSRFKSESSLSRHLLLNHLKEKLFACSQCPAKFAQEFLLKRHSVVHSNEKPFGCSQCPSKFTRKSSLKYHLRVHSNEKPFACSQCPAKFTYKPLLKSHSVVHSNEKPFACSQCPAKFAHKCLLKSHSVVHSNEKPFGCSQCPSKFARKSNLKDHLVVHSNERPFACSQCPSKFARKSSLKDHLMVHSLKEPFACSQCPAKFALKRRLESHLIIHSLEKPFVYLLG